MSDAPSLAAQSDQINAEIDVQERTAPSMSGYPALLAAILLLGLLGYETYQYLASGISVEPIENEGNAFIAVPSLIGAIALFSTLSVQYPGTTKVMTFFGSYIGTVRRTGLTSSYPFTLKSETPVRVLNLETEVLKVNERGGSPVNVAAIIVWRVKDTARATFAVDDYQKFIRMQSEAALRHVVASHPYDEETRKGVAAEVAESKATDADGYDGAIIENPLGQPPEAPKDIDVTLRGNAEQVSMELATEVNERVSVAGLEVIEARLSNLSYAPEIASAMLQVQQSRAVLAARATLVEGAAGLVRDTVKLLAAQDTNDETTPINLTADDQAALARTLLPVLVSGHSVQPVLNTGV